MVRLALFCVFVFGTLGGCEVGKSCTEVGCVDGASFTITTADGTWQTGAYSFELIADGATQTCSMTVPDDLPVGGSVEQLDCVPPASYTGVALYPDTNCVEQRGDSAVSQSCTPIPGHYTLRGMLTGTPSKLSVRVTRDDVVLLEQTQPLSYVTSRPNGPDCEPVCRQASVGFELP